MSHTTFFKSDAPTRFDAKTKAKQEREAHERKVYAAVNKREGLRCRITDAPVKLSGSMLEKGHHHHILYRSAGGPTETWNVILISAEMHNLIHKQQLRVEGNADEGITIWKREPDAPVYFIWRREIAVRRFEHD